MAGLTPRDTGDRWISANTFRVSEVSCESSKVLIDKSRREVDVGECYGTGPTRNQCVLIKCNEIDEVREGRRSGFYGSRLESFQVVGKLRVKFRSRVEETDLVSRKETTKGL